MGMGPRAGGAGAAAGVRSKTKHPRPLRRRPASWRQPSRPPPRKRPAAAAVAAGPGYGARQYWEARYAARAAGEGSREETNEWLLDFQQLEGLLPRVKTGSFLDLGCGVSAFLKDLRERTGGRGRLVGIDYAPSAVALCRRTRAAEGVEYLRMDARNMRFPDESFDVVLDKATLDGQLCGRGAAAATCREVGRVLRPGGAYILVTWRGPSRAGGLSWLLDLVLPALRERSGGQAWRVDVHCFADGEADAVAEEGFGRLPNVFVISKSRAAAKRSAGNDVPIKQHIH